MISDDMKSLGMTLLVSSCRVPNNKNLGLMEASFTVCTRNKHWEYDVSAALVAAFFRMMVKMDDAGVDMLILT